MTPMQVAVIVVIAIALIGAAIVIVLRNRTKKLRAPFGPEYDRAVAERGNKFKAEAELEKVEKRLRRYPLRPLTAADRDRFQQSWRTIQCTFVDDPARALAGADQLLAAVMEARGYPPSDFENRAVGISVDHATVVEHYRAGHEMRFAIPRDMQLLKTSERAWFITPMKRLAEIFADERQKLEQQWDRSENVSTADFRVALRKYHSFFARLLTI